MDPAELKRRYGNKLVNRNLLSQTRKYFDSGDYALHQAGRASNLGESGGVGSQHPLPKDIPHPTAHTPSIALNTTVSNTSSTSGGSSGSPVGPAAQESLPGAVAHLPKLALPGGSFNNQSAGAFPRHLSGLTSPVRESSFLQCETSIDDVDDSDETPHDTKPNLESSADSSVPKRGLSSLSSREDNHSFRP